MLTTIPNMHFPHKSTRKGRSSHISFPWRWVVMNLWPTGGSQKLVWDLVWGQQAHNLDFGRQPHTPSSSAVLGTKPRALYMLGKCSTTELYSPCFKILTLAIYYVLLYINILINKLIPFTSFIIRDAWDKVMMIIIKFFSFYILPFDT